MIVAASVFKGVFSAHPPQDTAFIALYTQVLQMETYLELLCGLLCTVDIVSSVGILLRFLCTFSSSNVHLLRFLCTFGTFRLW